MEQFRFRADGDKVIGAGGYSLDHDDGRNLQYTGLYQGEKIVALLVTEYEPGSTEDLFAIGDLIVQALNSHEQLVTDNANLRQDLSDARTGWEQATEAVREADEVREKLVETLRALDAMGGLGYTAHNMIRAALAAAEAA